MNKYFVTIVLWIAFGALDVLACLVPGPFNANDKQKAEVIFKANVISYKYLYMNSMAKIRFRVLENIKGVSQKEWEVIYLGNTNDQPPVSQSEFEQEFGTTMEVGIIVKPKVDDYERGRTGKMPPQEMRELPILVQGICNPPYLLVLEKAKKKSPVIFDEIFQMDDYQVVFASCNGRKCCESSVTKAKELKGLILKSNVSQCPDGWEQDMLKCIESRKWCLPKKN